MNKTIALVLLSITTHAFANSDNESIYSKSLLTDVSAEQFDQLRQEQYRKQETITVNSPTKKDIGIDNQKLPSAKKASKEETSKKDESKRIALSAKKDFENKIKRAWTPPKNSADNTAVARITLNDNGSVLSIDILSNDVEMKKSVEDAIRAAAPYPMPSDLAARHDVKSFTSRFTSK